MVCLVHTSLVSCAYLCERKRFLFEENDEASVLWSFQIDWAIRHLSSSSQIVLQQKTILYSFYSIYFQSKLSVSDNWVVHHILEWLIHFNKGISKNDARYSDLKNMDKILLTYQFIVIDSAIIGTLHAPWCYNVFIVDWAIRRRVFNAHLSEPADTVRCVLETINRRLVLVLLWISMCCKVDKLYQIETQLTRLVLCMQRYWNMNFVHWNKYIRVEYLKNETEC